MTEEGKRLSVDVNFYIGDQYLIRRRYLHDVTSDEEFEKEIAQNRELYAELTPEEQESAEREIRRHNNTPSVAPIPKLFTPPMEVERDKRLRAERLRKALQPPEKRTISTTRIIEDGQQRYNIPRSRLAPPQTPNSMEQRFGPYNQPKMGRPFVYGDQPGRLNERRIYEVGKGPLGSETFSTGGPTGRGPSRPRPVGGS